MMRRGQRPAGIALGSNVGDRARYLKAGLEFLRGLHEGPPQNFRAAQPIETAPLGCAPGTPAFLNTAAEIVTSLEAEELLKVLRGFETAMGRPAQRAKNEPRTLDLDILYLGEEIANLPHLQIPHPRLAEREFVLRPLLEICPQRKLPVWNCTVADLAAERGWQ